MTGVKAVERDNKQYLRPDDGSEHKKSYYICACEQASNEGYRQYHTGQHNVTCWLELNCLERPKNCYRLRLLWCVRTSELRIRVLLGCANTLRLAKREPSTLVLLWMLCFSSYPREFAEERLKRRGQSLSVHTVRAVVSEDAPGISSSP